MKSLIFGILLLLIQPSIVLAWGGYAVGGLTITDKKNIEVVSQDLYLSLGLVKSDYIFKNTGNNDILTDVKFILPSVDQYPDLDESHPGNFRFFHNNTEIFPSFTTINVDEAEGACVDGNHDCAEQTTYFWSHRFRPGKEVKITLQYEPAVAGDFGGFNDTENEYCVKDDYLPAIKKRHQNGFTFWMDHFLTFSPANNLGKVKNFRLVVDKGDANSLISFCGENVKKISPTKFEMLKTDYLPPESFEILWSTGFTKQ